MTLRRPEASLSFDGTALTGAQAGLTELRVELGAGGAHDRFAAALSRLGAAADVEPGATAAIGMGYAGDVHLLLTGDVTAVTRRPWGIVVEGLAAGAALSRIRIGRSYLDQTAADVASDLASGAGVPMGQVDAPLALAAYHVDERRPAWGHLRELARLAGCELTSGADGALNLRPPKAGPADHTLRGGADVLVWLLGGRTPGDAPIGVVPHGAGSEQGADKWHLLLREPDGSGGSDAPSLAPAGLRAREGAQGLASALDAARRRRALRGTLVVVGDPAIRAGDLLELTDMPAGEDATLRATRVTHRLDGTAGYRTAIAVQAA